MGEPTAVEAAAMLYIGGMLGTFAQIRVLKWHPKIEAVRTGPSKLPDAPAPVMLVVGLLIWPINLALAMFVTVQEGGL
jgi:hypothetical protein